MKRSLLTAAITCALVWSTVLEERLAAAITATASVIVSAWEQAGRPALKDAAPRPVEKVQRAQAR